MFLSLTDDLLKYKVTRFAGSTQHILVGDVAPLRFERTVPFSISAWVNTTQTTLGVFAGKSGTSDPIARGYTFHILGGGGFGANLNHDFAAVNRIGVVTANTFNDGRWHHAVLTYDGSSDASGVHIYADGIDQSFSAVTNALTGTILTTAGFRIGNRDVSPQSLPFIGRGHDVAVYNKELTAAEVGQLHNGHCPPDLTAIGPTASLVGYWLCGDHKGDANLVAEVTSFPTVPDASTNSNAGTMTNMSAASIETRR